MQLHRLLAGAQTYVGTDLGTPGTNARRATGVRAAGQVAGYSLAGARDLNDFIPANAGWVLAEARGVSDSGLIVGTGLRHVQPRASLLTPCAGVDSNQPVAALVAAEVTSVSFSGQSSQVVVSDYVSVAAAYWRLWHIVGTPRQANHDEPIQRDTRATAAPEPDHESPNQPAVAAPFRLAQLKNEDPHSVPAIVPLKRARQPHRPCGGRRT